VRLDECDRPRRLRSIQGVDYFPPENRERAYVRLRRSLEMRAAALGIGTSPLGSTAGDIEPEPRVPTKSPLIIPEDQPRPEPKRAPPDRATWGGIEFCRIPAGEFLMGSAGRRDREAFKDEKPQHTVDIPYDYWLARYPVTNALYAAYVKANRKKHPVSGWPKKKDHPVVSVSWEVAMDYCRWLNGQLKGELPKGTILRLPNEAEWERAARGADARKYPWGNKFDNSRCNTLEGGKGDTTPVGLYSPQGDSPYGCADMAGNVWEWTLSLYEPYPYRANDGREDEKASGARVVRGGSWDSNFDRNSARCASRYWLDPDLFPNFLGFRIVLSPD
jgi:formylglycine-generating enzyme required for sulfatase activity